MSTSEFDKAVRKEKNKMKRQLTAAKISAHKMKILEPVIDNAATMKVRLDDLREMIVTEDFMVEYDNGGGQKGIRENPVFKRYEAFFKTYMLAMGRIIDALPDEKQSAWDDDINKKKPQTALEIVMKKQGNTA